MTGRTRLLTLLGAGLIAAAPAVAQSDAPNPFGQPRNERFQHHRPGRHQAWRMERGRHRMEWRGERMERRGERWERHGRWMARHGHLSRGRAFERRGNRWEHRGERFERQGARFDHRTDRFRRRQWLERHHRRPDGGI